VLYQLSYVRALRILATWPESATDSDATSAPARYTQLPLRMPLAVRGSLVRAGRMQFRARVGARASIGIPASLDDGTVSAKKSDFSGRDFLPFASPRPCWNSAAFITRRDLKGRVKVRKERPQQRRDIQVETKRHSRFPSSSKKYAASGLSLLHRGLDPWLRDDAAADRPRGRSLLEPFGRGKRRNGVQPRHPDSRQGEIRMKSLVVAAVTAVVLVL
jgi:hypothetical protein